MDREENRVMWPSWQHRKALCNRGCSQRIRTRILHQTAHVYTSWRDQEGSTIGVTTMPSLPQSLSWPAPPHLVGEALALHVCHVGDDG